MKLPLSGVFLLTALLLAAGCKSSPESVINGTWTIDVEKTLAYWKTAYPEEMEDEFAGFPPQEMSLFKDMAAMGAIKIDTARGVMSGRLLGEDFPDTEFSIVSSEGNRVRIKEAYGKEIDIAVIDSNTISMAFPFFGGELAFCLVRK